MIRKYEKKVSILLICAINIAFIYHSFIYHSFLRKGVCEIPIGGNTFNLKYIKITIPLIFIIGIATCLGWMIKKKELSKKVKIVTLAFLVVVLIYFYLDVSRGLIN